MHVEWKQKRPCIYHDTYMCIFQTVQRDVDSMRAEYLLLKERILNELESVNDSDKAQFLRSEIGVINQRLGSLESSSSAYVQRYITQGKTSKRWRKA